MSNVYVHWNLSIKRGVPMREGINGLLQHTVEATVWLEQNEVVYDCPVMLDWSLMEIGFQNHHDALDFLIRFPGAVIYRPEDRPTIKFKEISL